MISAKVDWCYQIQKTTGSQLPHANRQDSLHQQKLLLEDYGSDAMAAPNMSSFRAVGKARICREWRRSGPFSFARRLRMGLQRLCVMKGNLRRSLSATLIPQCHFPSLVKPALIEYGPMAKGTQEKLASANTQRTSQTRLGHPA